MYQLNEKLKRQQTKLAEYDKGRSNNVQSKIYREKIKATNKQIELYPIEQELTEARKKKKKINKPLKDKAARLTKEIAQHNKEIKSIRDKNKKAPKPTTPPLPKAVQKVIAEEKKAAKVEATKPAKKQVYRKGGQVKGYERKGGPVKAYVRKGAIVQGYTRKGHYVNKK